MRKAFLMAVALVLGLAVTASAEVTSGPQVGAQVGAFTVTKVAGNADDGVEAGKSLCYRCKMGARPVVMVFARTADPKLAKLLKKIEEEVAEHESDKLTSFVNMIGGDADAVKHLDPIFAALAPGMGTIERTSGREHLDPRAEQGYLHAGPAGAGHFVKMIHNGIEYGMMQAFAEGFDIMKNRASEKLPADERFDLNLADIAEVWRRGSVVTSWLLDLTSAALAKDGKLEAFSGNVEDSGEGRWTIEAAIEEAVPADVLAASLFVRFRSRQQHTFAEKILSAMRLGFGGHVEPPKK